MIHHTYADALPALVTDAQAESMPAVDLVLLNEPLAVELGFDPDWLRSDDGLAFLCGHGSRTIAMGYAGHQFGQYSPRLGDGRALLLGEVSTETGLVDIHAKGTGPTPFSRGGDGRGTLTSMLREFLFSESLHALGVSTTRALAVLTTGRSIVRENGPEKAAILVRAARGLSRIGTFQYASTLGVEKPLADYEINRHYPGLSYGQFYEAVCEQLAVTVRKWMSIGFIHGVMNTDNSAITGETLDYGPCAFTDDRSDDAWFSSVDVQGRYRFGHQPMMMRWNLARLGESLLELVEIDELRHSLNCVPSMNAEPVHPIFYPRNHLVSNALEHARRGDLEPFFELLQACQYPFNDKAGPATLAGPAPEEFDGYITYCGT